jgi:hypothetical protein
MSEMIERVAKAMALKANGGDWDVHYTADQRDLWRLRARAAINAMREPTEAMAEFPTWDSNIGTGDTREIWREMIDEALR